MSTKVTLPALVPYRCRTPGCGIELFRARLSFGDRIEIICPDCRTAQVYVK